MWGDLSVFDGMLNRLLWADQRLLRFVINLFWKYNFFLLFLNIYFFVRCSCNERLGKKTKCWNNYYLRQWNIRLNTLHTMLVWISICLNVEWNEMAIKRPIFICHDSSDTGLIQSLTSDKNFGNGEEKQRKDSTKINNNIFFIPHEAKCIVFYSTHDLEKKKRNTTKQNKTK